MQEIINQLTDTIRAAAANKTPLCIRGGGSKDFYGGPLRGEPLSVGALRGIVDYEPTELVITARTGTPLAEIEAAAARERPDARIRTAAFRSTALTPSPSPARRRGERRAGCAGI